MYYVYCIYLKFNKKTRLFYPCCKHFTIKRMIKLEKNKNENKNALPLHAIMA